MEGLKQQSNGNGNGNCCNAEAEAFAPTTITTITTFAASASTYDSHVEQEILQGLLNAQNHEVMRRRKHIKVSLPPETEMSDDLLKEASPKIHPAAEEEKAKALTMDEYVALRIGLQDVIQSDVKEKMTLLRDQLSDYHSVLEDIIAFKSRCEQLEQEKQDLIYFCRKACQMRDEKIALLELVLAQLRNERKRKSGIRSDEDVASAAAVESEVPPDVCYSDFLCD
jgi:hypothetical protein